MEWLLGLLVISSVLAYHRASSKVWCVTIFAFLLVMVRLSHFSSATLITLSVITILIFAILLLKPLRQKLLIQPALNFYRNTMPTMSKTEKEALAAGTVGWEGDLFQGAPDWQKLLAFPKPKLTEEEQTFIENQVETLCAMIDDWDITHNRADLPPEIWEYLKQEGFFALIISKEFGGKAFSAYAHSQILVKIYSRSISVATTVAVPNSLGPAELLLHYGTEDQKNYYLPRLARGEEIPCFALTGPEAGSDAGAMSDKGVVCWGEFNGEKILGLKLNFDKRYITLAPVATVIGLAFKMYDPDHLLGDKKNYGITCALIPRNTEGVSIGRRHFPLNTAFLNGPIHGKDVFIPLDWIIGGIKQAGSGWRMLMECLASGRSISLPASSTGGAKSLTYTAGAYSRVRRQFKVPIGRFEGIEEPLARIMGYTYIMDATRSFSAAMIDNGQRPSVASAITKYHVTELGRVLANDAMDIHGGKGICLGPHNYIGRYYQSVPIAITVEGANILTRTLIIFGQGAMRCHPYVLQELDAAKLEIPRARLNAFDEALTGHISYTISNFVRTFFLSLTGGRFTKAPDSQFKRYFQQATRFSASFALLSDMCMVVFGGALKRKESISGRLGDVLSQLYLLSSVLKHFYDQGEHEEDVVVVQWSALTCFYKMQQGIDEILKNLPNRFLQYLLRVIIFPFGKPFFKPKDNLTHKLARLLMDTTGARYRVSHGAHLAKVEGNMAGVLEDALLKTIAAEPIEKLIKKALQNKEIEGETLLEQAQLALDKKIISEIDLQILLDSETARKNVIAVDDFSTHDLAHLGTPPAARQTYNKIEVACV